MSKIIQAYEEFIEDQKKITQVFANRLEEKGIYQLGVFNAPRLIFTDERVPMEVKLTYLFLTSLVEVETCFSPNLKEMSRLFEEEVEETKKKLNYLKVLGYIEEVNGKIKLTQFPTIDEEAIQQQFNDAKKIGSVLKGLDQLFEEVIEEGFELPSLKTLLEEVEKAKVKEVRVNEDEHFVKASFKAITEEIADHLPKDTNRVKVEIEFETGIVKVEVK